MQLQADLQPAGSVHVIRYDTIRMSRSVLAQKATSRPGWVSPEPPDGGSLNGVQSIRTALSGVECATSTPQQLTSRKPSTASSILPRGHRSSTTASNPHMWNFCNGSTANKKGTVLTDTESDLFSIKRGTKQGDPLSSLLFITVLQFSLEDNLKRWQEKQKGIR